MTDLDLDAIKARATEAGASPTPLVVLMAGDTLALVAEVERLTELADRNWKSWEHEATEHARTLSYGTPRTGEPLNDGEQGRFEAAVERGLRKRAEDQRDAALRALAAVRDEATVEAVSLARMDHFVATVDSGEFCCACGWFGIAYNIHLDTVMVAAVVARIDAAGVAECPTCDGTGRAECWNTHTACICEYSEPCPTCAGVAE